MVEDRYKLDVKIIFVCPQNLWVVPLARQCSPKDFYWLAPESVML
jgi:hypothetical protein